MSSDQPSPGSGEPSESDPFRKPPGPPPPGSGSPYDNTNPPPPPPPPPGGTWGPDNGPPPGPPPTGGGEPGGGPYAGGPYGGQYGAADPLAGMPPLANRGRRLVARIIDALIVGVPVGIILWLAMGTRNLTEDTALSTSATIITTVVYFVYEGWMLTTRGQTLGKMAMRIRVAMLENGAIPSGQPGWNRAGVYSLPQIVPCCGFLFWLVNVLFCTWDQPYHQCLHDKAAKTVVVAAD